MKRLLMAVFGLVLMAAAGAQVQINRWQDLKPYIESQTNAINDHGEKLRYQQQLIDKLIATVDQQRTWVLDFACKWNKLNDQLAGATALPPVGPPKMTACDSDAPSPHWPDYIVFVPPEPLPAPDADAWNGATVVGDRLRVDGTAALKAATPADQYVEAKAWVTGTGWNYVGLVLRARDSGSSTQYRYTISTNDKVWALEYIDDTGQWTKLIGGPITYKAGATMRMEARGSRLAVWYDGMKLGEATDTRITAGRPGLISLTESGTHGEFGGASAGGL